MRKIEQTYNISPEDKALFRALCETYDYSEINRYFNDLKLNENYFIGVTNKQSYSGTTPGTTERGIKGAVKALPSLVISTLLCPAGTLIALIGATRTRFEKQFTKSLLNLDRWADYVGTSKENKRNLVDKVKREVAEKTRYFIAKLANGEIIRVVASHSYEAKQMAIAIEDELIIPQEKEFTLLKDPNPGIKYESKSRDNSDDKLWLITYEDGEVLYWQASKNAKKEDIVKEANKQRQYIAAGFAKKFKQITGKKLQGVGNSYDKEYEPIKSSVVENIELIEDPSQYKKITDYNKETIEIFEGDRISSHTRQNTNLIYYTLKSDVFDASVNGNTSKTKYSIIECSLPTINAEELTDEISKFFISADQYYKHVFISEFEKYLTNIDKNYPTYIGQFRFANKCTILLPYQDKMIPKNLVENLSKNFESFLLSNNELDETTKKRIEKYVYDQRTKNSIKVNSLVNKLFNYPSNEVVNILGKYADAFSMNVKLRTPDENGDIQEEPINLDNVAA